MNMLLNINSSMTEVLSSAYALRGNFGEIKAIGQVSAQAILTKFEPCLPSKFTEFDKAGRGDALRWDLYGYCDLEEVAVIQVRHTFKRYRRGYTNQHKDYVLCGSNEVTKAPFRHPVASAVVRAAVNKAPESPTASVRAAQRWLWQVTDQQLSQSVRQGDVLVVPHKGKPGGVRFDGQTYLIGESHEIHAEQIIIAADLRVFAWSPLLIHKKGQHAPVKMDKEGWYAVRLAQTAVSWDWSQRLGD
ncbi:hypothetical protein ACFPL7_12245 [Dongia soli]|uniref:Uncharacterized protein n=1 Tax=Dongia soli TaxID=600628 RepID=A0ABU5EGN3_9PROT|nr:hypothetical protein [Dongia soli]MDY0885417.1 hypothetical protein [Dongia soli]